MSDVPKPKGGNRPLYEVQNTWEGDMVCEGDDPAVAWDSFLDYGYEGDLIHPVRLIHRDATQDDADECPWGEIEVGQPIWVCAPGTGAWHTGPPPGPHWMIEPPHYVDGKSYRLTFDGDVSMHPSEADARSACRAMADRALDAWKAAHPECVRPSGALS